MRVAVRNMEGQVVGTLELSDEVFGTTPNETVMHQAVLRQLANARQGTAETKTRGEVAGGGTKPFRQKGTGRARQGTIRAPQFRGGGVVFGPHARSYEQSFPRKMKRLALRSALSIRATEERLHILEELDFEAPSTKAMLGVLGNLGVETSTLILLPEVNDNVHRSARNIPRVKTLPVENINVVDLLNYAVVVAPIAAIQKIEGNLGGVPGQLEKADGAKKAVAVPDATAQTEKPVAEE